LKRERFCAETQANVRRGRQRRRRPVHGRRRLRGVTRGYPKVKLRTAGQPALGVLAPQLDILETSDRLGCAARFPRFWQYCPSAQLFRKRLGQEGRRLKRWHAGGPSRPRWFRGAGS